MNKNTEQNISQDEMKPLTSRSDGTALLHIDTALVERNFYRCARNIAYFPVCSIARIHSQDCI
jgi:hypothetical protein